MSLKMACTLQHSAALTALTASASCFDRGVCLLLAAADKLLKKGLVTSVWKMWGDCIFLVQYFYLLLDILLAYISRVKHHLSAIKKKVYYNCEIL